MRRRGLSALVLGVISATVAAGLPAAPGQAAPRDTATGTASAHTTTGRTGAAQAAPRTVTLITGDRVTVHAGNKLSVQAGPGRTGMTFLSRTIDNHRHVIPADALPLLQADRLDRRLFDITTLIESRYDDRSAELGLLVSYPAGNNRQGAAAARTASTVPGARILRDLPVVNSLAVRADRDARAALWRSLTDGGSSARSLRAGVHKLWLDGRRSLDLDVSVPQIGAPAAWRAGLDGKGVKVAVLDTGVDATHRDLAGQIVGTENFTTDADADDHVGHGTHVASTIAGTGAASGGRYKGVAPGAKLLNGKVCGEAFCDESSILAGMQWAAQQGAQVVNLSLGGRDTPDVDPLESAVNDLSTQYGSLFVISAGNAGSEASVGSPASADAALAVGAVDRDDKLADFSSRGPRVGDDAIKPEITAPGVDIVAAKATHAVIGEPAPVAGYVALSGTSMAAPHVAGAAAILTQQHPDWSPQRRKAGLMASAKPAEGIGVFGQGAGRVDVARAITQTVTSEPSSVSFGRQLWPHADDDPVTKTVTYRNSGAAPVTLALSVKGARPDGSPAPAGLFTLSATSLTVPAGGTAQVSITANTRVDGPDGNYGGHLTATAPGVQVQTPFAVNKEVESYDVTFRHTDRDGTPADDFFTVLFNLQTFASFELESTGDGAPVKVRLPKGDYGLFSWLTDGFDDEDPANDRTTMLAQPRVTIDANTRTLVLDARTAKPVSVSVQRRDATPTLVAINAEWAGEDYDMMAGSIADRFEGQFSGQAVPSAPVDGFTSSVNAAFAKARGDGDFTNSPYTYDLVYYRKGRMLDGLRKTVKDRDLATIRATYAKQAAGVTGSRGNFGRPPGAGAGWAILVPFDLPFRRTEYVNTDGGLTWDSFFNESVPPANADDFPQLVSELEQNDVRYRAGRTHEERWNNAVFAPSVTDPPQAWQDLWASRTGDTVFVVVPLHGDGAGHPGFSTLDKARTALYRNGTLVEEVPDSFAEFAVPPGRAGYRLEMSAERGAPHTLSTRVQAAWTFSSGHVGGETAQRLPLSSVRFSPPLDQLNTAPANRTFDIPVTVHRQAGSSAARNRSLTVQVSYDDGRTWTRAVVRGQGDKHTATVRHPRTGGYASLRATATDTAGNTVTQTVIRAYRIG